MFKYAASHLLHLRPSHAIKLLLAAVTPATLAIIGCVGLLVHADHGLVLLFVKIQLKTRNALWFFLHKLAVGVRIVHRVLTINIVVGRMVRSAVIVHRRHALVRQMRIMSVRPRVVKARLTLYACTPNYLR